MTTSTSSPCHLPFSDAEGHGTRIWGMAVELRRPGPRVGSETFFRQPTSLSEPQFPQPSKADGSPCPAGPVRPEEAASAEGLAQRLARRTQKRPALSLVTEPLSLVTGALSLVTGVLSLVTRATVIGDRSAVIGDRSALPPRAWAPAFLPWLGRVLAAGLGFPTWEVGCRSSQPL